MCWMVAVLAATTLASVAMQQQQASAQGKLLRSQAQAAKTSNALREEDRDRAMESFLGKQRARAGMSGVEVESFTSNYEDTAREFARQSYIDGLQTSITVGGFDAQDRINKIGAMGNSLDTISRAGMSAYGNTDRGSGG